MRGSEEQLSAWMVAGLDGNAVAHTTLLGALVPLLRAYFGRRMSDDDGHIEDLVQEVLIAVHTRRVTYDRNLRFTPWLYAIARHKMIDHFRKARLVCPIEELDDIPIVEGFEAASNARMDVDTLLETLPSQQARAIRRTKLEGASTSEVAREASISQANVKISVHRGLKALAARVLGDRR